MFEHMVQCCTKIFICISYEQSKLTKTSGENCLLQLEKLEQETVKWCREILRNSPTAIRVLKSALNAVDDGHAGLQVFIFQGFRHTFSFSFRLLESCLFSLKLKV